MVVGAFNFWGGVFFAKLTCVVCVKLKDQGRRDNVQSCLPVRKGC